MWRFLNRRVVLGGLVAASTASGFTLSPHCKKVTLDLERGTVSSIKASLDAALAKPEKVQRWIEKQGEHEWLEDVLGTDALDWVRDGNAQALDRLGGDPTGSPLYKRLYSILTSKEKIPHIRKIGDLYYNFWTDNENPRGVLRRTTLESYRSGKPDWETVLSIDALNTKEGESWVYKGNDVYRPRDGTPSTRSLIHLSRGGADATVVREFDLLTKDFVPEADGGFVVPEAKTRVSWQTADKLMIGTDFKDGKSLTDSGYPRTIREWTRGTPLSASVEVFAGEDTDVSITGSVSYHRGVEYEWHHRGVGFYTSHKRLRERFADGTLGEWCKLTVPDDATVSQFGDQLLVQLRSDWGEHKSGTLLTSPMKLLAGAYDAPAPEAPPAGLRVLFAPTERVAISSKTVTKNKLLVGLLDNVQSRTISFSLSPDGTWSEDAGGSAAKIEGGSVSAVDAREDDAVWLTSWSYLEPTTLSLSDAADGISAMKERAQPLRSLPAMFDASTHEVVQGGAKSKDGTRVPYFMVRPKDGKGPVPTILYGYGGFQISMTPGYAATTGAAWIERGGCYVEANIRGGGEFGPSWWAAAKREKRNCAYEDFEAVAEDLIQNGQTTPQMLACRGGSNGGLLVGNALVRRPDLWGAVVCAVPLLDMRRFNKLLAGASWMAEYGDPDSADWEDFLWKYSAYHHIDPDAKYPPMLMTTSTRDDRVHPYHARAFVARMRDAGHADTTTYYENIEGGHGGAADPKQQAFMLCLYFDFVAKTIGSSLGALRQEGP